MKRISIDSGDPHQGQGAPVITANKRSKPNPAAPVQKAEVDDDDTEATGNDANLVPTVTLSIQGDPDSDVGAFAATDNGSISVRTVPQINQGAQDVDEGATAATGNGTIVRISTSESISTIACSSPTSRSMPSRATGCTVDTQNNVDDDYPPLVHTVSAEAGPSAASSTMTTNDIHGTNNTQNDADNDYTPLDITSDPSAQLIVTDAVGAIGSAQQQQATTSETPTQTTTIIKTEPKYTTIIKTEPGTCRCKDDYTVITTVKIEPSGQTIIKTEPARCHCNDDHIAATTVKIEPSGDTSVAASPAAAAAAAPPVVPLRTSCNYGCKCYRRNLQHRNDMAHPGDPDYRRPNYPEAPAGAPDCPFGAQCYRREPNHFRMFCHPPSCE